MSYVQNDHCGVVYVDGSILRRNSPSKGELFARSLARVLRVLCVRVRSIWFMVGGAVQ